MAGKRILRLRWPIIGAWLLGACVLAVMAGETDPSINELETYLPQDAPSQRAVEEIRRLFPRGGAMSEAVIIFENPGGRLTRSQLQAIERVARSVPRPNPPEATAEDLSGVTVRSPGSLGSTLGGILPNPLISKVTENGQAALVVVDTPASFITVRSERIVRHVRSTIARHKEALGDLRVAVTGSSAFGHDYAQAARRSHERTIYMTLTAVVIILLVVYRAPIAALVPLVAISAAAVVAIRFLAFGQRFGIHVGTGEKIFVFVLLYGAGVDYSLLFISRYREFLDEGLAATAAAARGLDATLPAIGASAITDTAGLLMLCFARYGAFRTTGPAVACALVVVLAAAVTLVPALVGVAGRRMFWPSRQMGQIGRRRLWPRVSRLVSRRPGLVLVVTLAVLAVPAVRGSSLKWVYDTLAALRNDYGSKTGTAMAKRHWPVGAIAPVTVLVKANGQLSEDEWRRVSGNLAAGVASVEGVERVRSLARPLTGEGGPQELTGLARMLPRPLAEGMLYLLGLRDGIERLRREALKEYVSADMKAARVVAWLDSEPLALDAMDKVSRIRAAATETLRKEGAPFEIHIAGTTAHMCDIRSVTQSDFYRVAALALAVIFLVVLALLRDVIVCAFMVAGTVLSYLATLGVTYWVFTGLLGSEGLDWKVEVFLFVVMVAVGVDYSIFLAARIFQERAGRSVREATEEALTHTGPVISSCGVIMAATLGSLMAGDLILLQQLGFALALGMLVDTFIVRPLLLPAFVVLTRRRKSES